jgi:hypothetical protein
VEELALSRSDKLARMLKEQERGLIYWKVSKDCKSILSLNYEEYVLHNIIDIYKLKGDLCKIKSSEKANFETLLGRYLREYNFGCSNEMVFHSNFESGNLASVFSPKDGVYYLEMSADTNSVGNMNWFYFKTSWNQPKQKTKFRVINFNRPDLRCSQIYSFSEIDNQASNTEWTRNVNVTQYYENNKYLNDPSVYSSKL